MDITQYPPTPTPTLQVRVSATCSAQIAALFVCSSGRSLQLALCSIARRISNAARATKYLLFWYTCNCTWRNNSILSILVHFVVTAATWNWRKNIAKMKPRWIYKHCARALSPQVAKLPPCTLLVPFAPSCVSKMLFQIMQWPSYNWYIWYLQHFLFYTGCFF